MKKLLVFFLPILFFSCAPKATKEQNEQYESCKKKLIENKVNYLSLAESPQKKDSLQMYLDDVEKNNLDQLMDKYDVEPEFMNELIFSICQKAELATPDHSAVDELIQDEKSIMALDSINRADSLSKLK